MKKETIIKSTILISLVIAMAGCLSFLLHSSESKFEEPPTADQETVETADLDTEERSETEQQEKMQLLLA